MTLRHIASLLTMGSALAFAGCGAATATSGAPQTLSYGVPYHVTDVTNLPGAAYYIEDFVDQQGNAFTDDVESYCGHQSYMGSDALPGTVAVTRGPNGSADVRWQLSCPVLSSDAMTTLEFRISQNGNDLFALNHPAQTLYVMAGM